MNKPALHMVRGALVAAFSALSALPAAAASDAYFGSSGQVLEGADPMVAGTIPWGPPGLPEASSPGPQGPVRTDTGLASDPSIRDTNPLTMNGLWEMLPGNRVVSPARAGQPPPPQ